MKRVLTILALLLLPLSVWAMTPVSDSDLSNVTGQAGVNINADLLMNVGIGTMAWGDESGLDNFGPSTQWDPSSADNGGYVGVTNFNLTNLRIKARDTNDNFGDYSAYGTIYAPTGGYNTAFLKPITIDVAQSALYGGRTFVRFGLGSLVISMDSLSMTVALDPYQAAAPYFDGTLSEELGSVNVGAMALYINPESYVDITSRAAGGQGVRINTVVTIDELTLGYVSWGDSDGLPEGNTGDSAAPGVGDDTVTWMAAGPTMSQGYIGLENLKLGIIKVNGLIQINVATSAAGAYNHGTPADPTYTGPVTVCHISFGLGNLGYFNVNVAGPITANVKLDDDMTLNTADAGTLGDIYISGFNLDIAPNSWIDIWAH